VHQWAVPVEGDGGDIMQEVIITKVVGAKDLISRNCIMVPSFWSL
jgi:hypothetical protein